ncbi:hypothetical protein Q4578_06825 [Shimia thalassica]|uniref:hypothetical protein n=1 Tax=Shimia thalassica TaxID=1715693 RepID=UPI0026E17417|nr:hypothetical protein [Shimia thalassica]MDO6521293.1 hypothetical protein [Shimia thalassica]
MADLEARFSGQPLGLSLAWLSATTPEQQMIALERMLDSCYIRLVDARKHNQDHDEDALSIQVVNMLEAAGVDAAHDRKIGGHCDITVKAMNNFLWIGEAKIHGGYDWLDAGFLQLSSRYGIAQRGRDRGEIIIYHRGKHSADILRKWKIKLEAEHAEVAVTEDKIEPDLYFRTTHKCDASGLDFCTRHKIVPMYFAPKK